MSGSWGHKAERLTPPQLLLVEGGRASKRVRKGGKESWAALMRGGGLGTQGGHRGGPPWEGEKWDGRQVTSELQGNTPLPFSSPPVEVNAFPQGLSSPNFLCLIWGKITMKR